MSGRTENPVGMVRAFCKKHRICARCFKRRTERDTTRCRKCNEAHAKTQKSRLRRNYDRDVLAGVCVRCHKLPATATNNAAKSAKIATPVKSETTDEGTADHQTDSAIIFSCVGATDFRDVSSLSRSISKRGRRRLDSALQHRTDPGCPYHPPTSKGTCSRIIACSLGVNSVLGEGCIWRCHDDQR